MGIKRKDLFRVVLQKMTNASVTRSELEIWLAAVTGASPQDIDCLIRDAEEYLLQII